MVRSSLLPWIFSYYFVLVVLVAPMIFQSIPTLQIPLDSYYRIYGYQVTIPCSITSATPSATNVSWTRNQSNNIININNGDSGYQGSTVGSPSLTINFATNDSDGVYTCFATNAVGTGASNPTTLTIFGVPGHWSTWSIWENCDFGIQKRTRACVNPYPEHFDIFDIGCTGNDLQTQNCTTPRPEKGPLATADILKNLTTVDINGDNIKTVIETVKNMTSDPGILTSIDVIAIADVLVHIPNDTLINQAVVIDIFDIIDNVLNVDPDKLKKSQNDGSATNRLLKVLDTISHTLDLENKSSMQFLRENVLMNVFDITPMSSPVTGMQIEAGKAQSLTTSNIQILMADTNITVGKIDAAIILPVELINNINNSIRVTLLIYRNWNLFSVRSDIREYLPNSRVMSASISVDGIPIYSLGQYRVQVLFFPRMESEYNECGYWNYDLHDKSGGWATSGCDLNRTEYGRHICVCDHLTNFAVLVNIGGQDTLVDSLAINIISWIGLILSIAGLSLTILSFFLFKRLRKGRVHQTLFNLALSMLCFLIVFIVGIEQTHDFYGCIVVAALLHYFILVAFMWMLMEGILHYLGIVKVLGTYVPNFILKSAVAAWGVPLIPVVIVVGIDHKLYHGGKKACWMSLTAFYYAFAIPVGIIILANAIIFGMILKNLLCRPKGLQSNQSERKRAMVNLRAACSVFVLLGLTWIFGFFTIEEASIVFQYIFTILNVLQGFLIFVLFTAREKPVHKNWKKLCCKIKSRNKYIISESSSEMNKIRIRNNVNNSGSEVVTREVLT